MIEILFWSGRVLIRLYMRICKLENIVWSGRVLDGTQSVVYDRVDRVWQTYGL